MLQTPRLYADSADAAMVGELLAADLVVGVTTNPTILERDGRRLDEIPHLYERWVEQGAREVFFQTWGATVADLLSNAQPLLSLGERIVVKVPATPEGFVAARTMINAGASVLVTAVYTPAQALAAAAIGARYIAPYLGRLRDAGHDGTAVVGQMAAMCAETGTDVLAASIRSAQDFVDLRDVGVSYFTAAPAVLRSLLVDDVSTRSAAEFDAAIERISG